MSMSAVQYVNNLKMLKFSEYRRQLKESQNSKIREDAVAAPGGDGGSVGVGDISAPSSQGFQPVGDVVDNTKSSGGSHGQTTCDVLGKCDHDHNRDGIFGPGCFHLPYLFGYPVYRFQKSNRKSKKNKKKNKYSRKDPYKMIILKEEDKIEKIQGLEGYEVQEILKMANGFLEERIEDYQIPVRILDLAIIGSRNRHTAKEDSDLDIAFSYESLEGERVSEDHLFNMVNEEPKFEIEGIPVDFNPHDNDEVDFGEYLEKAHEYDEYVLGTTTESIEDQSETERESRDSCQRQQP